LRLCPVAALREMLWKAQPHAKIAKVQSRKGNQDTISD
jgi:hypothetical protein